MSSINNSIKSLSKDSSSYYITQIKNKTDEKTAFSLKNTNNLDNFNNSPKKVKEEIEKQAHRFEKLLKKEETPLVHSEKIRNTVIKIDESRKLSCLCSIF